MKRTHAGCALALGLLCAAALPARAGQLPQVVVIAADVKNSLVLRDPAPVAQIMTTAVQRLFEGAGHRVTVVTAPEGREWLADAELAQIARRADAEWVVYPRILSLGSQRQSVAAAPADGSFAALYVRIVDATGARPRSVYMRQVGHAWGMDPARLAAYAEPAAIPEGVTRLFQFFRPLEGRLRAAGLPSLEGDPGALARSLWTADRTAGFRGTTASPGARRVPVLDPNDGRMLGFAEVSTADDGSEPCRAVFMLRRPVEDTGLFFHLFVPVNDPDPERARPVPAVQVLRLEGVTAR